MPFNTFTVGVPTLKDLEAFCREARRKGANDETEVHIEHVPYYSDYPIAGLELSANDKDFSQIVIKSEDD